MTADGFSLDDQRQPVKENDIPDIINRFNNRDSEEEQNRARTEKSFFVPKEEIVENDYDLSINKYKEIVIEKKEYENPKVILKRVIEMEDEIQQKLKRIGGHLMSERKKLSEICNILNGYAFKSKEYVDNGIRVIRITNVQKGIIEDADPKYYDISQKR